MSIALSIIMALIVLGILIAIHEYGHYKAGRLLGFTILEYSIGMGPIIFKKRKNDIDYTLRLLPIGGMCKFHGEDDETVDEKCFNAQAVWKRMIVVMAGPLMNVVFAIVVGIILFAIFGGTKTVMYQAPQITEIAESSAAEAGGLQIGDFVTEINGVACETADEMIKNIRASENNTVEVTVIRPSEDSKLGINGTALSDEQSIQEYVDQHYNDELFFEIISEETEQTYVLSNIYDKELGYNRIGASITSQSSYDIRYGFFGTIGHSFTFFGDTCKLLFEFLGSIFTGEANLKQMSGIIGVVDVVNDGVTDVMDLKTENTIGTGDATKYIIEYAIYLMVLLSINLGIVNALPLPALDGGRFVFMIIEAIFKKPVPVKIEGLIHTIGFVLLLGLVGIVTLNDIVRVASGVIHLL